MLRGLRVLIALAAVVQAYAAEGVRNELTRLQEQTGQRLIWYERGIQTLRFGDRSVSVEKSPTTVGQGNGLISPDASEIALPNYGPEYLDRPHHITIVRPDGAIVREYAGTSDADAVCWSHNQSKLVVQARVPGTRPAQYHLLILDLDAKSTQEIGGNQNYATSQCWSPDDRQLVFTADNGVRVYDLKNRSSRTIAQGSFPTWSPDGQWIAFSDHKAFYAVSPAGTGKKMMFKGARAFSGLWWSPDSRFVAYLSEGGTLVETLKYLDVGLIQICIRRLADGAEDWVYQTPDVPPSRAVDLLWVGGTSIKAH